MTGKSTADDSDEWASYYTQDRNKEWRRSGASADHLRDEIGRDANNGYHGSCLETSCNLEGGTENTMIRTHIDQRKD